MVAVPAGKLFAVVVVFEFHDANRAHLYCRYEERRKLAEVKVEDRKRIANIMTEKLQVVQNIWFDLVFSNACASLPLLRRQFVQRILLLRLPSLWWPSVPLPRLTVSTLLHPSQVPLLRSFQPLNLSQHCCCWRCYCYYFECCVAPLPLLPLLLLWRLIERLDRSSCHCCCCCC